MLYFTTMFALFIILSLIVFKFIFWMRLKDDFPSDSIFQVSFLAIGLSLLLGFGAYRFYPSWWFWASFVGLEIGVLISSSKNKMNKTEVYEASIIAIMPVYFTIYTYMSLYMRDWMILLLSLTTILAVISFKLFDKYYKKFTWYRSGRIGFAGFSSAGIFFVSRAIVAYLNPDMLSLLTVEIYISILLAIVHFAYIIKLSR